MAMTISPLPRFIFAALLWLPFAFFLWFAFASQLTWPVMQLAKLVLLKGWPTLFIDVLQGADQISASGQLVAHQDFWIQINTNVLYNAGAAGQPPKLAFFDFPINPLIYGYCLPLFAGLVMATPLDRGNRVAQLLIGLAVLWLVQTFGVVSEAFKTLGIQLAEGGAAMQRLGYSLDAIALCYQFGYLILPSLVPAVLWILFNRPFIEELTRPVSTLAVATHPPVEPNPGGGVETQQSGD
jgi:hypothetical protein